MNFWEKNLFFIASYLGFALDISLRKDNFSNAKDIL